MSILGKDTRRLGIACKAGYGILWLVMACVFLSARGLEVDRMLFTKVNSNADPNIRSIIQLADQRMFFLTQAGGDIFNGSEFTHLAPDDSSTVSLPGYNGFHHLYLSHHGRYLWIKNMHTLQCVDLFTEEYVRPDVAFMTGLGFMTSPDDLFGDDQGNLYSVERNALRKLDSSLCVDLDSLKIPLLDVAADSSFLYLFYSDGSVDCHRLTDGERVYTSNEFPIKKDMREWALSQIVMSGGDIYQKRNLPGYSCLLKFSPSHRGSKCLFETDINLNTLEIFDEQAFITSNKGLLTVNLRDNTCCHYPQIRTRSGNTLASEISTIRVDSGKGIWLGLIDRGILRYSPGEYECYLFPKRHADAGGLSHASSVFADLGDGSVSINDNGVGYRITVDNRRQPVLIESDNSDHTLYGEYGNGASFISSDGSIFFNGSDAYEMFVRVAKTDSVHNLPLITAVAVNGEPYVSPDGRVSSRLQGITLDHNRNFVTVQASLPLYDGSDVIFYYKLDGNDIEWNRIEGQGEYGKLFRATYNSLHPGEYTLRIKTSPVHDSPETRLDITIKHPWWDTPLARVIYIISTLIIIIVGFKAYMARARRRIAARQRESLLLERIRHLIEEVDRYKSEAPVDIAGRGAEDGIEPQPQAANDHTTARSDLSDADRMFLARAVELVEVNINTPGYSVEQLSRDMCMDRTGLYRKLTALLDRSPSLFIRDIRLRNAARLLKEGQLTVTEIADATGFSTTSYMSKCFQERYGCRPSEYRTEK